MWEIDSTNQIITTALSAALGGAFSLLYDFFKAARLSKHRAVLAVFFEDIFFCIICTFFTFCLLMLRTNGQLRGYALVGIAVGFLLFRFLISRFTVAVLCIVFKSVLRFFGALSRKISDISEKTGRKAKKFLKKFRKTIKNS